MDASRLVLRYCFSFCNLDIREFYCDFKVTKVNNAKIISLIACHFKAKQKPFSVDGNAKKNLVLQMLKSITT